MLLAFHCYLRVSELTRLTYGDIVRSGDRRTGRVQTVMALRLRETKTGINQWVSVTDETISSVLTLYLKRHCSGNDTHHETRVFAFTPDRLRRLMRRLCAEFGMRSDTYVPHSLRHGGATLDYMRHGDVNAIMLRGRWKSLETARRYIQTGRAMLADMNVQPKVFEQAEMLATHISEIMTDQL